MLHVATVPKVDFLLYSSVQSSTKECWKETTDKKHSRHNIRIWNGSINTFCFPVICLLKKLLCTLLFVNYTNGGYTPSSEDVQVY